MIKIKFRAFDKVERKWVKPKGNGISFPYAISPRKSWDKRLALFGIPNADYERIHWMQSTGLLDKNGKEIWDGDIVKHKDGRVEQVLFVFNSFKGLYIDSDTLLEVIGNIYDNPELVEE